MATRNRRKRGKADLLKTLWPVWLVLGLVVAFAAVLVISSQRDASGGSGAGAASRGEMVRIEPAIRNQMEAAGVALGDADAPVTIFEFADYQCPACARFSATLSGLKGELIDSGQARVVFLDFPLSGHVHAEAAAMAARCAGRQRAYWPMHDTLFERQSDWSGSVDAAARFTAYARELGLDEARFRRCLDARATAGEVATSATLGRVVGVRATPTVIIGNRRFSGGPSADTVRRTVAEQVAARNEP